VIGDGVFALFPTPSIILGQHVGKRPSGTVSFTVAPAMAAADSCGLSSTGRVPMGLGRRQPSTPS
jgi:metal-dependent amidase/aminoacylase/carboxypeptidase family protein